MGKLIDINGEFLVEPANNGIKLTRPQLKKNTDSNLITVNEMLKSPINVHFTNTDSVIQNLNEAMVMTCGYSSVKSAIGNTVRIAAKSESAEQIIRNDSKIITNKKMEVLEENFVTLLSNNKLQALSFKYPWFDDENRIIGVFACCIILGSNATCSLPDALGLMIKHRLLTTSPANPNFKDIIPGKEMGSSCLSRQELQCVKLLMKGMTMKMIAKYMNISPRTVEHYLENVKLKLNATSRAEIFDKMIVM